MAAKDKTMEFYILAKQRYSLRKFSDKPVEEEKLKLVLEAGRAAPTAHNNQPQRVYVLQSQEALAKAREITPFVFNAPVVLMVCGNQEEAWVNPTSGKSSAEMDASIVATHMMLQIAELGLNSTWACHMDFTKVKEAFHLPQAEQPFLLMPLGYPADGAKPSRLHNERKVLSETVVYL